MLRVHLHKTIVKYYEPDVHMKKNHPAVDVPRSIDLTRCGHRSRACHQKKVLFKNPAKHTWGNDLKKVPKHGPPPGVDTTREESAAGGGLQ